MTGPTVRKSLRHCVAARVRRSSASRAMYDHAATAARPLMQLESPTHHCTQQVHRVSSTGTATQEAQSPESPVQWVTRGGRCRVSGWRCVSTLLSRQRSGGARPKRDPSAQSRLDSLLDCRSGAACCVPRITPCWHPVSQSPRMSAVSGRGGLVGAHGLWHFRSWLRGPLHPSRGMHEGPQGTQRFTITLLPWLWLLCTRPTSLLANGACTTTAPVHSGTNPHPLKP